MIRKNNLGQAKKVEWGHLGKRKVFVNEAFKTIELERERERFDWKAHLQPFRLDKEGTLVVMMPEKGTTPTPPPENEIWNTFTSQWENITDSWNNV
jgi:hypothetical protein